MKNNENAVKILESYLKEIYKSLGKEWTAKNETDMKNIVEYLNENKEEVGIVLEDLGNGKVKVKLKNEKIIIANKL